ncbi:MAG: hypothetical protein ABI790_01025 [Betaproteobacteria bacterium]
MRFLLWVQVVTGMVLAVILSACAGIPDVKMTPEQAVMSRAQERWDALLAAQFDKAYAYISPAGRLSLPLDVFRSRISSASWRGAKVTRAVCEPEVCDVTLQLDVNVLPNLPYTQTINEKWILDGGKWWFVYRG